MADEYGWIPPDARTDEQNTLANEFLEQVGTFGDVGADITDVPDRVIFAELALKHLRRPLVRVYQTTGSCVGSGGAWAYQNSMLGDLVARNDREMVKPIFPFATYGVGRSIAGMRRQGSGSFGAAQAKACQPDYFGYLPYDDQRFPQPRVIDSPGTQSQQWYRWSSGDELTWSHPSAWPVRLEELKGDADDFGIANVTRITSTDQLVSCLSQLYAVTLASMFGTRPTVRGDVLIGNWNTSWAHQMACTGYWKHAQHGLIFQIDNQWGPRAHPSCPTLSTFGVYGSFWMTERDMARVIKSEVFAHSSTNGFPERRLTWDDINWV